MIDSTVSFNQTGLLSSQIKFR